MQKTSLAGEGREVGGCQEQTSAGGAVGEWCVGSAQRCRTKYQNIRSHQTFASRIATAAEKHSKQSGQMCLCKGTAKSGDLLPSQRVSFEF